jgi:hypothetical protein
VTGQPGERSLDVDASGIASPDPVEEVGEAQRGADLDDVVGTDAYGHRGSSFRPRSDRVANRRQGFDRGTAEGLGGQRWP